MPIGILGFINNRVSFDNLAVLLPFTEVLSERIRLHVNTDMLVQSVRDPQGHDIRKDDFFLILHFSHEILKELTKLLYDALIRILGHCHDLLSPLYITHRCDLRPSTATLIAAF